MNLFEELRVVEDQKSKVEEFPAWLLADIMNIVSDPERYADKTHLVELLIDQIGNYDPYTGVGCFDTSSSAEMIQATIRQIKSREGN